MCVPPNPLDGLLLREALKPFGDVIEQEIVKPLAWYYRTDPLVLLGVLSGLALIVIVTFSLLAGPAP